MQLYRNESSHPLSNAQRNLCGRTYYVDQDALRYHKSRVLSARTTDNGLLFAIVTSDALDINNTQRGFRYVIFDLFGTVLERPKLDETFRTSRQAENAMWTALNAIDAKAVTLAAIERHKVAYANEMDQLALKVAKIEA